MRLPFDPASDTEAQCDSQEVFLDGVDSSDPPLLRGLCRAVDRSRSAQYPADFHRCSSRRPSQLLRLRPAHFAGARRTCRAGYEVFESIRQHPRHAPISHHTPFVAVSRESSRRYRFGFGSGSQHSQRCRNGPGDLCRRRLAHPGGHRRRFHVIQLRFFSRLRRVLRSRSEHRSGGQDPLQTPAAASPR